MWSAIAALVSMLLGRIRRWVLVAGAVGVSILIVLAKVYSLGRRAERLRQRDAELERRKHQSDVVRRQRDVDRPDGGGLERMLDDGSF